MHPGHGLVEHGDLAAIAGVIKQPDLQLLGYLLVILIQLTPVHPWPNLFRKIHYLVLGHWYNGMGTLRYCLRAPMRFMSQEKAV